MGMRILYKNVTAKKQFCSEYKKRWRYPEQVKKKLESAENYIRNAKSLMDIANYIPFHFEHLKGDLDFDASPVLRGEKSMEELAVSLCQEVLCTCQGKPTCAEKLGHKEFYIPYKYQEARRVALPPCGQSL